MCSGGADSTNVVWSFLNNGIHVDEVVASAPMSGLRNWQNNTSDISASNTMSETVHAQLPLLNEIKSQHPSVKISINDYFENIINFKTDEWLFRCGEWIHPSGVARYNLEQLTHLRDLADSGKTIGIVYGIDKPIVVFDSSQNVKVRISDLAVNVQRQAFEKKYPNVENVLFYWTPSLPQMLVKQTHQLLKWLALPENKNTKNLVYDQSKHSPMYFAQNRIRHSFYERAIVPCIYPGTYRPIFQGAKPTRMFLGEHDDWFYKLHFDTRMFEMVESDFRNFIKTINPKYLNAVRTGFNVYVKSYNVGAVSNFFSII